VLKTVATIEQFEKWKNHTIAIADITEPGAGSDPANIRTNRRLSTRETDEWILNGEKIFISQAEGQATAAMVAVAIRCA